MIYNAVIMNSVCLFKVNIKLFLGIVGLSKGYSVVSRISRHVLWVYIAFAILSRYVEREKYAVTMLSGYVNWVNRVVTRTYKFIKYNKSQLIGLLCLS